MMRCLICESNNHKYIFEVKSILVSPSATYKIFQCARCQLWHADGPVDDDIINHIYGEGFHNTSQQSALIDNVEDIRSSHAPIVVNAKRRLNKLKEIKKSGSLLDIGAGRGFFVYLASEYYDAYGIEISKTANNQSVIAASHLISGDFLNYDFKEKRFDILTFWDVVACFSNPSLVISKAAKMLNPNGVLVMTLPYSSSLVARYLKRFWPLMIPPINLNYFSEKSIGIMLRNNNLSLISMEYESKSVSLDFIIRKIFRVLWLRRYESLIPAWTRNYAVDVNLYDIVTVYGRKETLEEIHV